MYKTLFIFYIAKSSATVQILMKIILRSLFFKLRQFIFSTQTSTCVHYSNVVLAVFVETF